MLLLGDHCDWLQHSFQLLFQLNQEQNRAGHLSSKLTWLLVCWLLVVVLVELLAVVLVELLAVVLVELLVVSETAASTAACTVACTAASTETSTGCCSSTQIRSPETMPQDDRV